ncbi:MAG TPA: hypothetical protein VHE99_02935 [Gammaproteobacteria bacterium]|nr:hypothetical protein [Gammaproteobacteria bacterium]HVY53381.1 hypothetical protein [Gammaproteobacteria bacterium]
MKENKFTFCLSGYGYWIDSKKSLEGTLIKIRVLSGTADDIELECVVDASHLVMLENLKQQWRVGEYVVMYFTAHYLHLSNCQSGLTAQDPKQMVQLKGKLISLRCWLQDGEKPAATSPEEL